MRSKGWRNLTLSAPLPHCPKSSSIVPNRAIGVSQCLTAFQKVLPHDWPVRESRRPPEGNSDPPAQLYDVAADPAEKHNLYAKHPEIVHQLMLTLQKIQAEEGYKPDRPEQPKEQLTIDQLNALFREGAK